MPEQYDEREEFLSIVRAAREQLEYYRNLGLTHIGGYNKQAETIEDMARKKKSTATLEEPAGQASLFDTDQPARSARSPQPEKSKKPARKEKLADIRAEVGHCCGLCDQATNVVFGEGNPKAEVMFIGEAPGGEEDATGRPFVGAAGRLLDKIIEAMGNGVKAGGCLYH
jgi:hypothetical protein